MTGGTDATMVLNHIILSCSIEKKVCFALPRQRQQCFLDSIYLPLHHFTLGNKPR